MPRAASPHKTRLRRLGAKEKALLDEIDRKSPRISPRPAERTCAPQTAAAEVGWLMANYRSRFRLRWGKSRASCDVTRYADTVWRMGRSPFINSAM